MVTLVPLWYQVKEGLEYPVTRTLKTTSSPSTTSQLEGNSLMVGAGMRGGIGEWREGEGEEGNGGEEEGTCLCNVKILKFRIILGANHGLGTGHGLGTCSSMRRWFGGSWFSENYQHM